MKLLRLKHWQLFLITFAIPFVAYLIGAFIFAFRMIRGSIAMQGREVYEPQLPDFLPLILGGVLLFAGVITHYVWMYRIATKLQDYMHPDMRKMRVKRFKIFFFSPWIYMLFVAILLPISILETRPGEPMPAVLIATIIVMIPGHLYSLFCMIYILYFTAKTVKSAEIQREAHFGDYIGEFFLLWFFPVGIWFIQPKINKTINPSKDEFESGELLEQ